jgi:hypothetical protein
VRTNRKEPTISSIDQRTGALATNPEDARLPWCGASMMVQLREEDGQNFENRWDEHSSPGKEGSGLQAWTHL